MAMPHNSLPNGRLGIEKREREKGWEQPHVFTAHPEPLPFSRELVHEAFSLYLPETFSLFCPRPLASCNDLGMALTTESFHHSLGQLLSAQLFLGLRLYFRRLHPETSFILPSAHFCSTSSNAASRVARSTAEVGRGERRLPIH